MANNGNNKYVNYLMGTFGLIGTGMIYGSYRYYMKTLYFKQVKRDLSEEKEGYLDKYLLDKDMLQKREKYPDGPKSITQAYRDTLIEDYDQKRYRLISGITLKEQKKSKLLDNQSISTYLSKIDGTYTIANVIYHGCLSNFDLSFNAGMDHKENRYSKPTFYMLDTDYANKLKSNISMEDKELAHRNILQIALNNKFGAWQLPQKRKLLSGDHVLMGEARKNNTCEFIKLKVNEGVCLSAIGTITLTQNGDLQMTNLVAVMAGGLYEAKRFLKAQIKKNLTLSELYGIVGVGLLAMSVIWFLKKSDEEEENPQGQ